MVIGDGMIARRFAAYATNDNYVIFASGVSDSGTVMPEAFEREEKLLRNTIADNPAKNLVYFSTCGIYDRCLSKSAYFIHKLNMENIIRKQSERHCIFRVSNPVGFTNNTHTVLNYFFNCIYQEKPFELWNKAYRNLLDLDDMYIVCNHLLVHTTVNQQLVNIANPENYAVLDIVQNIEKHTGKKAFYKLVDKTSIPEIDTSEIETLFILSKIQFKQDYLPLLLQKYFPQNLTV